MSLQESQALSGVHPWLAVRIIFMREVIDLWGGGQRYLSGVRTREQQQALFFRPSERPVAAPGCSQHQYGYAVDIFWLPIINFAQNLQLTGKQTDEVMIDLGQQLGLVTVRDDTGHFQVFPGSEFKAWAVASGFCDPNSRRPEFFFEESLLFRLCGPGSTGFIRTLTGIKCNPDIRQLILDENI